MGTLTYWDAAKLQVDELRKGVLAAVAMRGLGDRIAFRNGEPTPRTARILAYDHCRTVDDLKRHIERFACCQYCGGDITDKPTCPNCGVPREDQ